MHVHFLRTVRSAGHAPVHDGKVEGHRERTVYAALASACIYERMNKVRGQGRNAGRYCVDVEIRIEANLHVERRPVK